MSQDNRARLKEWLESGEIRLQPLTFPQRELWESAPMPPADASNNICAVIYLKGPLTKEGSEAALQKVVDRQEVFRLSFLPGKNGPLQMIRRSGKHALEFHELSASENNPESIEELAREIFETPFELLRGPLYRATVFRRSPNEHVLAFAIHHSIADGWTLGVFVQDLFAAYLGSVKGNGMPLPPVPQSYSEWGAAERAFWTAAELEKRAAWWRNHLSDAPRLWSPPADPTAISGLLQRSMTHVPPDLGIAVRELARKSGATLYSTLLAAFQIALSKWTGADDIVVGTPVANRNKQAVRETMGYCAGIVPIRGQIDPERSFSDSLQFVHRTTVEAFAHAMPFAELAKGVGDASSPGYNPVFEVRFALQNHPVPDVSVPGLSLQLRMRSTGTARFDLACEITEQGDGLDVEWLFRDQLFPLEDIQRLCDLYLAVLASVCRSPEITTSNLMTSLP